MRLSLTHYPLSYPDLPFRFHAPKGKTSSVTHFSWLTLLTFQISVFTYGILFPTDPHPPAKKECQYLTYYYILLIVRISDMSLPNKTIWSASVIKSQRKEAVPLFTKLYQEDSLQKSQRTG